MKHLKIVLLSLSFCLMGLTGCGFHFRDSRSSSSVPLKSIYVQDTANSRTGLEFALRQNLQALNIKTVAKATQSPLTLTIVSDNFSQGSAILGTAQQLNALTLNYTVTIVLKNSQGENITQPRILTTSASFWQNANQILGDSAAIPALKQSLIRDMSQKILAYLNSQDTQQALHVTNG